MRKACFWALCALLVPGTTRAKMSANGKALRKLKLEYWENNPSVGLQRESVFATRADCTGGVVDISGEMFRCEGIDFLSYISLADAELSNSSIPAVARGTDIWGWSQTNDDGSVREITLWTTNNALWFIDSTDPLNPLRLAVCPFTEGHSSNWGDVKVVNDFAWFGKDGVHGDNGEKGGILGFDMNKIAELNVDNPDNVIEPDTLINITVDTHNLISNQDSNRLYGCGGEICEGGLIMLDVSDPLAPVDLGCADQDGYTHDAQCVVYDGPDPNFQGDEICFGFNEDSLTIYNLTDPTDPKVVSKALYIQSAYTHQGWLTKDMKYALVDDEYDEENGSYDDPTFTTKTYVVDVIDLTAPVFVDIYSHETLSPDHNLYFWGVVHERGWGGTPAMENPPNRDYAYLSNYVAGLRVLDASDITNLKEIGYFDVAPDKEGPIFSGTWSNYMHPSGVVAVSSIDRGLFFLQANMAYDEEEILVPGSEPTAFPTDPPFIPATPPPGWTCSDTYYDNIDGCDCDCGVRDPDCDRTGQSLYGCDVDNGFIYCVGTTCSQSPPGESDSPVPSEESNSQAGLITALSFSILMIILLTVALSRTSSQPKEEDKEAKIDDNANTESDDQKEQ